MLTREDDLIESLYCSEYAKLLGYALKRVGKMDLAQDLVQDTFHEAVKYREKLRSHPNPQGWLMQTLKNKVLSYEREYARYIRHFVSSEAVGEIAAPSNQASEFMQTVEATLTAEEFYLFKRIILRRDSHLDVAAELGITVWACQKRLSRIKEKLKKAFREHDDNRIKRIMCQLLLLAAICK
ncbi:MAG: RNA polymerase sigma factor [Faecousia sp.]